MPTSSGKTLALLRHGESEWNRQNLFTGWVDVGLSPQGEKEARQAGRILKLRGFAFDFAFTSRLKRAIRTLELAMAEMNLSPPTEADWRLNERHYGALQGKNKQEIAREFGDEQVRIWRRSFDIAPPPLENSTPAAESLKDTLKRVAECWDERIAPQLRMGGRVIISAHGNSLRALVKRLDGISDDDIPHFEIPTGIPLVYELDDSLSPLSRQFFRD